MLFGEGGMGGSDWRLCVRASLDRVSKHGASAPALGAIACGKGNLGATAPGQRPITLRVHAGAALHFFSGCAGVRPWGSAPNPAAFEKAGKTFTCLSQTQARAFQLVSLSRPRRLKAPFAACPARPRAATREPRHWAASRCPGCTPPRSGPRRSTRPWRCLQAFSWPKPSGPQTP